MPYAAVHSKKKMKELAKQGRVKKGKNKEVTIFQSKKTGSMKWVTFKGGYRQYKQTMQGHTKPNLSFTGRMLNDMKVLKTKIESKQIIELLDIKIPEKIRVSIG
jgi:hypothetical protein